MRRTLLAIGLSALLSALAAPAFAGFAATDLVLPSVGRGPGSADSQWYTTVWVYNPHAAAVDVTFHLYLRNQANPAPAAVFNDTVAAGDIRRYDNAVQTLFGVEAFGAIRVLAAERLVVNSRIYSVPPELDEASSSGQFFAAVPTSFALAAGEATDLLGAYQTSPSETSTYRYNFGFVETAGGSATVRISVLDEFGGVLGSKSYAIGAYEPRQYNLTNVLPGVDGDNLRVRAEVLAGSTGEVVVFGSGLANQSNDPSTFEMTFADDLLASAGGAGTITGVVAGDGMTGGGASGTVTLNVGAGSGITVGAATVSIADAGVTKSKLAAAGGTSGQVLSTDGSGLMWSTPAAGGGLTLPFSGSTSTSGRAFEVTNTGPGWAGFFVVDNAGSTYPALVGQTNGAGIAVYGNAFGGATGVRAVSNSGRAVEADSSSGIAVHAVQGQGSGYTSTGPVFATPAVWAESSDSYGVVASSDASYGGGLAAFAKGSNGRALSAVADGSGGTALYAVASGSAARAAYLQGDVQVTGTLSKGGGAFQIDHPLDPTGRYLQHSFVESPDMMNVYNGNILLDEGGEATVELPEWFEALNRDFRYQLTPIGGFAPLYVAEEIQGNRFRIAGGEPGMKVSWQVTGVRHDPWAQSHRIQVEVDKGPAERGRYLHPEAYGITTPLPE